MKWILGLFVAVIVVALLHEYWPRQGRALFEHRHRQWLASCRRRKLSATQMNEELAFRRAMARLRRRASEAAVKCPAAYEEAVAQIAKEETASLLIRDRGVAKRFLKVVNDAATSDILYPEAMAVIDRHWKDKERGRKAPAVTEDDIAAVTTR